MKFNQLFTVKYIFPVLAVLYLCVGLTLFGLAWKEVATKKSVANPEYHTTVTVEETRLIPKQPGTITDMPEQYLVIFSNQYGYKTVLDNKALWSRCKAGNKIDVAYTIERILNAESWKRYQWDTATVRE